MTQNSFWIGLAAAALAAAAVWLVLTILPSPGSVLSDTNGQSIQLEATNPWIIGDSEDAFSYSGTNIRTIQGTAKLLIHPSTLQGAIEFELALDEALASLLRVESLEDSVTLRMQLDDQSRVWADQPINRGADIGESRLPITHARFAGSGEFELLINSKAQPILWNGFWAVADALRQPDGAIRDQGLVFSPLLRDQSVFSDPTRLEFTLLLYDAVDSSAVILHVVFPDAQDDTPKS